MNNTKQQNFYPISMLSTFVGQIDQLIEALEEQHKLFSNAKNKPGSLDDHTINRASTAFSKNSEYIGCYHEQLIKWKKEVSSDAQKKSLDIFTQKIAQARALNTKLIDVIQKLKETTINKILEKDDFELGLECLLKNSNIND